MRELHIPDRKNTASLGKARLLLDTTDALLQNGGDLGRGGLGVGGVESSSVDGGGCGISGLCLENPKLAGRQNFNHAEAPRGDKELQKAPAPHPSTIGWLN
jgi:hypothetical protein